MEPNPKTRFRQHAARCLATLLVAGGLATAAAADPSAISSERPGPCALLTDADIRIVQGDAPVQRMPSEEPGERFRLLQCRYRTTEQASSLSIALAVPLSSDAFRTGPRDYWRQRFHAAPGAQLKPLRRRIALPKPVPGLGEEAFWVAGADGSLYVLKGDVFVRLSVEGAADDGQKADRASALASQVMKRLAGREGGTAR
jgi:hypothetical protein